MITTVINSLVNHVYALLIMLTGWLTSLPAPITDALFALLAIGALGALLWLLTSAEQGSHRRPYLQPRPPLPKTRPLANDNCIVIKVPAALPLEEVDHEGVHVGAHADWHPADDVAAVDNDDAQWLAFLADARRERRRTVEQGDSFGWSDLEWGADMYSALATADAWHAEHGAHCACCHVTINTGEHVLIDRGWRVGSDTIEIPIAQLEAAGAR